jgi:hypothetical protein
VNPTRLQGYTTDAFTDLAIDYVRQYERDEPLFLVLSINPPHFPLEVPEQWIRLAADEPGAPTERDRNICHTPSTAADSGSP